MISAHRNGMGDKKILIVEDHADCRELLAIVLARSGYAIFKARTGQEGLDLARIRNPDLILTDFGLPDMTGDQMINQLKADPATDKIPAILTTGYMDEKVAKNVLAVGAAEVMVKPFDIDKLMIVIQRYLFSEHNHDPAPLEPPIDGDRLNTESMRPDTRRGLTSRLRPTH